MTHLPSISNDDMVGGDEDVDIVITMQPLKVRTKVEILMYW